MGAAAAAAAKAGREEAPAGYAVGPVREDAAELERVPFIVGETDMATQITQLRSRAARPLCRMGNGFGMLAFAEPGGRVARCAAGAGADQTAISTRGSSIIRRAPSASSSSS